MKEVMEKNNMNAKSVGSAFPLALESNPMIVKCQVSQFSVQNVEKNMLIKAAFVNT